MDPHHMTLLLQVIGSHLVALDEGLRSRVTLEDGKKLVGSPTADELELASEVVNHLSTISREVSTASVNFTAEQKRILRSQITAYRLLAQDVALDTILLAGATNSLSPDAVVLFGDHSKKDNNAEKLHIPTNVESSPSVYNRKRKREVSLEEREEQRKALPLSVSSDVNSDNETDTESDWSESDGEDKRHSLELIYEVIPDGSPVRSRSPSGTGDSSADSTFPHIEAAVDIDRRFEGVVAAIDPDARDHVTTLDETRATLREQRQILSKQCNQLKGEIVEARVVAERAQSIVHQKAEMLKLRQQQHRQLEHCLVTLEAARAHVANNLHQQIREQVEGNKGSLENGEVASGNRCCICLDKQREIAYIPCGHLCVCRSCHRPAACPICRTPSTSFLRIFN